ncbi:MAG: hypothetical protein CML16_04440 [Pusillimonas sp.]|nr:hypothetical protein [Pusillimonas sp.]MBC43965.1 hypothetical protein [Pusillimonas sp.]HCP78655.1 hypothetical protein [Pusillimonas sp.]|tara:strand:+ start:243 stop:890 length:648 start_codon:yes stop_codon:yes gene_type:complete
MIMSGLNSPQTKVKLSVLLKLAVFSLFIFMVKESSATTYVQTIIQQPLCQGSHLAHKPQDLAKSLLADYSALYNSIPTLSPAEQKWLKEESMANSVNRRVRAANSREDALETAKGLLESIKASLEYAAGHKPQPHVNASITWSFLSADIIDYRLLESISRLVAMNELPQASIPTSLNHFADPFWEMSFEKGLTITATQLAEHILRCIMPQVVNQN